jgi:hypothetical protein
LSLRARKFQLGSPFTLSIKFQVLTIILSPFNH